MADDKCPIKECPSKNKASENAVTELSSTSGLIAMSVNESTRKFKIADCISVCNFSSSALDSLFIAKANLLFPILIVSEYLINLISFWFLNPIVPSLFF